MTTADLGSKIKTARIRASLSQADLARRMGFRSTHAGASVCRWESGTLTPSLINLGKLARVLGLDLPALFGIVPLSEAQMDKMRKAHLGRPMGAKGKK